MYEEVGTKLVAKPLNQSEAQYEFDQEERAHEYEVASFSNSGKSNEYTYAEVGPYEEVVSLMNI